jgi:hypothetical protein
LARIRGQADEANLQMRDLAHQPIPTPAPDSRQVSHM